MGGGGGGEIRRRDESLRGVTGDGGCRGISFRSESVLMNARYTRGINE